TLQRLAFGETDVDQRRTHAADDAIDQAGGDAGLAQGGGGGGGARGAGAGGGRRFQRGLALAPGHRAEADPDQHQRHPGQHLEPHGLEEGVGVLAQERDQTADRRRQPEDDREGEGDADALDRQAEENLRDAPARAAGRDDGGDGGAIGRAGVDAAQGGHG